MENELKHKLGNAPNSEFVFDPAGKVVRHRGWSAPSELRKDLEQLVGTVEKPTQVADLKLKTAPPPKAAASGVVPRVQVSGSMRAFKVTAEESKEPHYVKLRAEVDQNFMSNGLGKLYLGFHLDPLYHVHWNNLVEPISFELELPENVTVIEGDSLCFNENHLAVLEAFIDSSSATLNNITVEPLDFGAQSWLEGNLQSLSADHWQLSGGIPIEICQLNQLESLELHGNELTGVSLS